MLLKGQLTALHLLPALCTCGYCKLSFLLISYCLSICFLISKSQLFLIPALSLIQGGTESYCFKDYSPPLVSTGFQDPRGYQSLWMFNPLYKMTKYFHTTYTHLPVYLKSSADYFSSIQSLSRVRLLVTP